MTHLDRPGPAASVDPPFIRGVVCQLRVWYPPVSLHGWSLSLAEESQAAAAPASSGLTHRRPSAEHEIEAREELRGTPRTPSAGSLVRSLLWATIWRVVPQILTGWVLALVGVDTGLLSGAFQIATGCYSSA